MIVSASCAFFALLAVDRPTLGWRQAQDKGIGPMMSDSTQPWAAPEDRPSAQPFRPLPIGGAAAPAFFERCSVSLVPGRRSALPCLRIYGTESRAATFLPRDAALPLRLP